MSTALLEPANASESNLGWMSDALVDLAPGRSVIVTDVSWETYQSLMALRDRLRTGISLSFFRGRLEFVSKTNTHELLKKTLAAIIEALALESGVPFLALGETTIQREDLEAGFEPDEWYYFGNHAEAMVGTKKIDFQTHPAPDLAVEIEVSHGLDSRIELFAAIGIREIWHCRNGALAILHLQADGGGYEPSESSLFFPAIRTAEIDSLLKLIETVHSGVILRRIRDWAQSMNANIPRPPSAE